MGPRHNTQTKGRGFTMSSRVKEFFECPRCKQPIMSREEMCGGAPQQHCERCGTYIGTDICIALKKISEGDTFELQKYFTCPACKSPLVVHSRTSIALFALDNAFCSRCGNNIANALADEFGRAKVCANGT